MQHGSDSPAADDSFLSGAGELGALFRAIKWQETPVGALSSWPQSLRTTMSICLNSRFPIAVYWGADFLMLYNESLLPMVGARKHPQALGQPARVVLAEIWSIIEPLLEHVRTTGEATWSEDLMLPLARTGGPEESYFTFTYSPVRDESGGVGGVFCAVVETTGRVIEERRLRLLNALANIGHGRSVIEACAHAANELAHAPQDVPFAAIYLLVDSGAATLAGSANLSAGSEWAPASVRMGDAPWHLDPADTISRDIVLSDGPPQSRGAVVMPIAHSDGGAPIGFIICGLSALLSKSESYTRFHTLLAGSIAQNITNAMAAEEERKRVEALAELDRAKTAFFSNISHEFRTPLTLLLGPTADALAEADTMSAREHERWSLVQRNGLRLLKLVNNLLEYSRIEAGRIDASYEPTDLAALTSDIASLFRSAVEKAGIELRVQCPSLPDFVYVDREMWEKVVLNLLSNAFKFTFEGHITISLRWLEPFAELTVQDSGVGIPMADLPRVFERFHRVAASRSRTHEGTGIGLALVQELARLHGGAVTVDSTPGRGTTFVVRIKTGTGHLPQERVVASRTPGINTRHADPFLQEALSWLPDSTEAATKMRDDRRPQAEVRRARIVVADDNADMRLYVSRLLGQRWDVEAVADGDSALSMVRARRPDLVVADVMMPALDGFQLLAALRDDPATRHIPVMLVSARAGEEAALDAIASGADDYVVKPFTARDLVGRVEALLHRAAVRESELLFRVMADAVPQIVWITGADGQVEFLNQQWTAYTGASVAPLSLADLIRIAVHPDDAAAGLAAFEQALRTGEMLVLEHRIRSRHGDYRWFLVKAYSHRDAESGEIVRWFGVAVDIHDQKASSATLAATAARDDFRLRLVDSLRPIADPAVVQAMASRVLGEHLHAQRVAYFELRGDDYFVEKDFTDGVPGLAGSYPVHTFGDTLLATYRSGVTAISRDVVADSSLTAAQRAGYQSIQIGAYIGVPLVKHGQLVAGLTVHSAEPRDWTSDELGLVEETAERTWAAVERARAEAAIRANEALLKEADRRKDEFLAVLAHELRNPLAPIRTGLELLRLSADTPASLIPVRDMMQRQVAHMVRLIDDLMDVSRISSGKVRLQRRPTALATMVNSALDANRSAIAARGLELSVDLSNTPCILDVDPTRFVQVVSNLLHNATKFTPSGGTIRVEARVEPGGGDQRPQVTLSVKDSGVGMSAELLPHVFDLFTQGERSGAEGGLGIGLALARQLIEMHGGRITAQSAGKGQGSTFDIRMVALPSATAQPADVETGTNQITSRVLVIDDNRDAADATAMLVAAMGGQTAVAYDGESGFERLLTFRPDVVLLDIGMQPVDGYETCRRIREECGRDVVIVALTGWGQEQDKRRAHASGFDAHLTKPIDAAALSRVIV